MILKEDKAMHGMYILQAVDVDTNEIIYESPVLENVLTSINREYRQAMLDGTFTAKGFTIDGLQIRQIALGTDATPANENQTSLVAEAFRRPLTSINSIGNDTTTVLAVLPTEANFRIREIGVFAGPDATGTPGSGTMISRIVVDFPKTDNIRLNIIRIDRTVI